MTQHRGRRGHRDDEFEQPRVRPGAGPAERAEAKRAERLERRLAKRVRPRRQLTLAYASTGWNKLSENGRSTMTDAAEIYRIGTFKALSAIGARLRKPSEPLTS
jgi:hypothetical protein